MNYEEVILNAFECDLIERRQAGASYAVFEGNSAKHRVGGTLIPVEGVPPEVLAFCVRAIFGKGRAGTANASWRGYPMSAAKLHRGSDLIDHLVVRLNLT